MQNQQESQQFTNYRFNFTQELQWKDYLKQNGFVVIANYYPKIQADKAIKKLWKIIQVLSNDKVKENDQSTHYNSQNYPFNLHGGMIQYVGHSQIQWDLRKVCKPIYEKLWNTKQLSSSFDGFCFMNGKRKYSYAPPDKFLHTDQAPSKKGFWCYQGLLNLVNSTEDSGGLVLIPKSHKSHRKYFQQIKYQSHKNWYVVPEQHKNKKPFLPVEKLILEAGDFAIWDSRTFHCNTTPQNEDLRICTYIAMIPKQNVPPLTKKKRQQFFKQKKSTNHHPGDGMKAALECPRFIDNKKNFMELVNLANDVEITDKQVLQLI